MRHLLLVAVVAACGGSQKPAPKEPEVSSKPTTRRIVEDDSEPETGVTLVGQRGRMDVDAISKALAPHAEALSECYTSRVGKRRWLGGNIEIQWDINKDGDLTAVKMAASDLGAWAVEKCVLEIARTIEFPKPSGGDADFSVPLNFWLSKTGARTLDEEAGLRAVGGQINGLDACDKALAKRVAQDKKDAAKKPAPKKQPKDGEPERKPVPKPTTAPDNVIVTVYSGPGGVQSVGFASKTSMIEDGWAECAEKAAMAWRVPDTRGQIQKFAVTYKPTTSTAEE